MRLNNLRARTTDFSLRITKYSAQIESQECTWFCLPYPDSVSLLFKCVVLMGAFSFKGPHWPTQPRWSRLPTFWQEPCPCPLGAYQLQLSRPVGMRQWVLFRLLSRAHQNTEGFGRVIRVLSGRGERLKKCELELMTR